VFSALSRRQLAAMPAAILLMASLLLAGPADAPAAKVKKSTCISRSTTKAKRDARRGACPARKRKGHDKAKRRHAKHVKKAAQPATTDATAALCDNGAAPYPTGNGSFSCADGSEPGCEDGFLAAPSASGSALVCAPADGDGSASTNATCEEESMEPCSEEGSEQAPEGVEGSTEGD